MLLHPVPFVDARGRSGRVELDVLAVADIADQPGFELFDAVAVGILHHRRHGLLILVGAKDEADHRGFDLLADQFGGLPVPEFSQRPHGGHAPGHAAVLHPLAFEEVGDPIRADPQRFKPAAEDRHRIAGVVREHPITPAAAQRVVFDALDDPATIRLVVELCAIEVIGLIELDLHW
jgi:hypothetical protein